MTLIADLFSPHDQPSAHHFDPAIRSLTRIFRFRSIAQVTAEGLDPRTTPVSAIMTKNPMVTRDTTSATQALQLMVDKHFRHLVSTASF